MVELDPQRMQRLEDEMTVRVHDAVREAIGEVTPDQLGCGDPDRVTEALVAALGRRGVTIETDEHRAEVREKWAGPIAAGQVIASAPPGAEDDS